MAQKVWMFCWEHLFVDRTYSLYGSKSLASFLFWTCLCKYDLCISIWYLSELYCGSMS